MIRKRTRQYQGECVRVGRMASGMVVIGRSIRRLTRQVQSYERAGRRGLTARVSARHAGGDRGGALPPTKVNIGTMSDHRTLEQFVESVRETITDQSDLSDLAEEELLPVKVYLYKDEGYVGFAFGSDSFAGNVDLQELTEYLKEQVKPIVDKRKFTEGDNANVGFVLVRANGDIAGFTIDDEYKKPSKR